MRRNKEYCALLACEIDRQRRARVFQSVGWDSGYAPDPKCAHAMAREIENNESFEIPDPLPEHWFPIRLRHWICDGCGAAANPHAFLNAQRIPLSEKRQRAWWDSWRAYERRVHGYGMSGRAVEGER